MITRQRIHWCEVNHEKQWFLQLCRKKALWRRETKNNLGSSTYSKTLITSWDSQPNKLIKMNFFTKVKSNENDKCQRDNKNQFWKAYDKWNMQWNIQWNMQRNVIETISNLEKLSPTKIDDWKKSQGAGGRGEARAVWNFTKNASIMVWPGFPQWVSNPN